jgi:translation initiation factor eIF-2B subunit epsilon
MPPRKTAKPDAKAAAAAAAAAANDLATEQDPLRAVILADSFNRRFDVLCVDKPRVSYTSGVLRGAHVLRW